MKIIVKSKPNAKEEKVELISQAELGFDTRQSNFPTYKVSIKEMPIHGQANLAITKALAKYFKVAPSLVNLVSGQTSKQKVFEILE